MRPDLDATFLAAASLFARRTTCARRGVGCILTDAGGHILSTGWNGVPTGHTHCIDYPCKGANQPSGKGLELCESIHSEQNALIRCKDSMAIDTCYVTASPCIHCVKMLMNTGCMRIVYLDEYPHGSEAKKLWTSRNVHCAEGQFERHWTCYSRKAVAAALADATAAVEGSQGGGPARLTPLEQAIDDRDRH